MFYKIVNQSRASSPTTTQSSIKRSNQPLRKTILASNSLESLDIVMNPPHIFSILMQASTTPMNAKKYRNIFSNNYIISIAIMIARTPLPIFTPASSIFLYFGNSWKDGHNIFSIDSEGYISLERLLWSKL